MCKPSTRPAPCGIARWRSGGNHDRLADRGSESASSDRHPRDQRGRAGRGANFVDSLQEAIGHINDAQTGASQAVDALVTGQNTNIHQAMVAMQQADASFQLMMQVRNKLVTAYEEIQRMQI
ncbi:MAG: flagellar hook-basal body complex protein FliE [Nitrospira sp.]|nr:flagellar hook-basal body complex protein FliE [Nitrospira sp.]